jgi:hypothetical protein
MADWTDEEWDCFKVIRAAVEVLGVPRSSAGLVAVREVARAPVNWRDWTRCWAWWQPGPALRHLTVSWEHAGDVGDAF